MTRSLSDCVVRFVLLGGVGVVLAGCGGDAYDEKRMATDLRKLTPPGGVASSVLRPDVPNPRGGSGMIRFKSRTTRERRDAYAMQARKRGWDVYVFHSRFASDPKSVYLCLQKDAVVVLIRLQSKGDLDYVDLAKAGTGRVGLEQGCRVRDEKLTRIR